MILKKGNKKLMVALLATIAVTIISLIILLVFLLNQYEPDDEDLKIINEASVTLYQCEVTGEYKQVGRQKIDGTTFYKFEFELKNGNKATFEFAKDLKDTYMLYVYEKDERKAVLLNSSDVNEHDNVIDWPDEWS